MTRTLRRRLRSIPLAIAMSVVLPFVVPPLLPLLVLWDVLRPVRGASRWAFSTVRLALFGVAYFACEVGGLIVLSASWLRHAGRPDALFSPTYRIQGAWAAVLLWFVERIFDLRFQVEGRELLAPGPVLVLVRHASLVDTLLPTALLSRPTGMHLRFVLKRELENLPCLDVAGHRIPNCFVERDGASTDVEVTRVAALADALGPRDGVLIYPEGTRWTKKKLEASIARVGESHPERLPRVVTLRSALPIRPGGVLALLERAPEADVVIVAHHGLDGLAELGDIVRGGLVGRRVVLRLKRFRRAEIPVGAEARLAWLDERWLELDAWLQERSTAS